MSWKIHNTVAAKLEATHGGPPSPVNNSISEPSNDSVLDQVGSSQIALPSPPPVIKETAGKGSPIQPVRFSDDLVAFVPIIRDK